jgi:hypothetical protein
VAIPNHRVVKIAQLGIAFIFPEAEGFPKNFLYWACPDAQHAFRHPMFAEPSKVRQKLLPTPHYGSLMPWRLLFHMVA